MKKLLIFLIVVIGLILSIGYHLYSKENTKVSEQASIVLEKITEVEKLMLVEGTFAEIYTYQQEEKLFFDLLPVEKKVIVLIRANANVGYDLNKVDFEIDKENQKVIVRQLPKELVLVEPSIQYYDVQQSQLYPVTGKDLTTINQRAAELIKQQVIQSNLPEMAKERLPLVLEGLIFDESTQNWQVVTQ